MSFYESVKIIVNALLILMALILIFWFVRQAKVFKINKRLGKYSISTDDEKRSLFDVITDFFVNIRTSFSKFLSHSTFLKKYSLKYEKFIDKNKPGMHDTMDFVATKFILAFLFLIILLITTVIQNDNMTFLKIILAFTLGFFSLDIFLLGRRKMVNYRMQNDLLKAITIMNNSFKSGRSIVQTIKIVSKEIDGPLKEEFKKMDNDIEYGLEIEEVFKRFNERVDLAEVKYITTSLTILNKTGGNIIDVFSSIEKTIFNNKKLDDELKNMAASSKALYHILIFVPFLFAFTIYVLDSSYFEPLFKTTLGIMILVLIILIYVAYIVLVKKIIRIKEY